MPLYCTPIAYICKMDNFSDTTKLEPDDFYWAEEGYRVFTEKYHLKRGR